MNSTAQRINLDKIPVELKELKQWVLWKYETRDGKKTKVPYQPSGQRAESNNPATWSTYQDASAALSKFDGLGIVFANGLAGMDLDQHFNAGKPDEFAQAIVNRMSSYTEVTPSGSGLHVLFWGDLPPGGRHNHQMGLEMYSSGRYFTVTGCHLESTPKTVENRELEAAQIHKVIFGEHAGEPEPPKPTQPNTLDDQDLLEKAVSAQNGSKFLKLWEGDFSEYPSHSEADLALCSHLAFWTGGDIARMDRLFRQSGLMRDQWDKPHRGDGATYGEMTMQKAISNSEFYNPPKPKPEPQPEPPPPPDWEFFYPPDLPPAMQLTEYDIMDGIGTGRFQTFDALDALGFDEPENWLVEGLAPLPSVISLVGAPGTGKSYTGLDLSVCAALGEDWLDFKTQKVKVLLIDEESGTKRLKRRLARVIRGHFAENGLQRGDITCASLSLLNLNDAKEAILLQAKIEEVGAKLVVIDALIDVSGGANENAAEQMHPIFQRLRKIADETECCFIVLHHSNKIGGVRGSIAIPGACDLVLLVEKNNGSNKIVFNADKARDIGEPKFAARLNFSPDQTWLTPDEVEEKAKALKPSEAYVIQYLTEHGATPLSQIAGAADVCEPETAKKAVYSLVAKDMVYRTNPDEFGRGTEAIYAIKEKTDEQD